MDPAAGTNVDPAAGTNVDPAGTNVDCASAWSHCSVHCGRRFNSDATDEQRSGCPEPPCLAGDGACPRVDETTLAQRISQWQWYTEPSGRIYYYNATTHISQYERPAAWDDVPDVDCAGTWGPCTAACEKPQERQWTETASQSGSGAACPAAQRCLIGDGGCSEGWVLAETDTSCTAACNGIGKICTTGNWSGGDGRERGVILDANLEVLVSDYIPIVLEDPGQNQYYPFLDTTAPLAAGAVAAAKFASPVNTSECDQVASGANADNIKRLCKCGTDVVTSATTDVVTDVDCAGTWAPCTATCETAASRQWTETSAQSGSGAACPLPQDCQAGEGACSSLGTWTLSSPAQSCNDACTDISASCNPDPHNLSDETYLMSTITDVLGDQLTGVSTDFWMNRQSHLPVVSANFEKIIYNAHPDATFNCEVDAPTTPIRGFGDWRRICHCL